MSPILDDCVDYGGDILDLSCETPMSRTHQYRKVMKPLLERKRRARINKCLDELKDLMVTALQAEGESITKLEKADVLEMTVRHLQKLNRQRHLSTTQTTSGVHQFRDGFASCVTEVGRFVSASPDAQFAPHLMTFLGQRLHNIEQTSPKHFAPVASDCGYVSDRDSVSPSSSVSPVPASIKIEASNRIHGAFPVWRPF